jgi:hypothetical protein
LCPLSRFRALRHRHGTIETATNVTTITKNQKLKTKMKLAIIITSDPNNGEEALGRAFNALALAAEAQARDDEVNVVFAGTGTRWPAELSKPSHPANGLYNAVRPVIAGASCGCSAVFGAAKEVVACGLPEIKDHALPGTPGLASIRRYLAEGWQTLVL